MLQRADIDVISIFQSTPENVRKYLQRRTSRGDTFLLSDRKGKVYNAFSSNRKTSIVAAVYGLEMKKNALRYWKYVSLPALAKDVIDQRSGPLSQAQLPAIFAVDKKGIIVDIFRAATLDDHMPFERLEAFIPESRRCKCNRKDCIASRYREMHAEIRQQAEAMIFTG